MRQKVLIIKTGYLEFLENGNDSAIVSLGDIIRTTPILHIYKNDEVTWVTDKKAFPLLEGNEYISRILPLDFTNAMNLLDEDFDRIINLEKNSDICKFANQINAWSKHGFRYDKKSKKAEAYDRAFEVLTVSSDINVKRKNKRTFQDLLFEMVGEKWEGEEPILGYQPKNKAKYDVGFNMKVGKKWPIKAWPEENWNTLEKKLESEGLTVTRQDKIYEEVKDDINKYIDWLNSCRTIVSNDSLGLHLGIALKKNVLGLFGPTPNAEIYFYGRGKALLAEPRTTCIPCFQNVCKEDLSCMKNISVDRVYKEIIAYAQEYK